ncbi:hypothetical protein AWN90_42185 [Nocardia terpenica]|uniref:Uncharacterized protein n=1 Tax=Nocardia terpenica TaxID=455432 RepID=A0A164K7U0_9NOCA|nr:hypothetical protein AWN90_42185 [Nocardia terpenica]
MLAFLRGAFVGDFPSSGLLAWGCEFPCHPFRGFPFDPRAFLGCSRLLWRIPLLSLLLARQLTDARKFELLTTLHLQATRPNLAGLVSGDHLMREFVRMISGQCLDQRLRLFRYRLTFDGSE